MNEETYQDQVLKLRKNVFEAETERAADKSISVSEAREQLRQRVKHIYK